jgi:hypothetical protein
MWNRCQRHEFRPLFNTHTKGSLDQQAPHISHVGTLKEIFSGCKELELLALVQFTCKGTSWDAQSTKHKDVVLFARHGFRELHMTFMGNHPLLGQWVSELFDFANVYLLFDNTGALISLQLTYSTFRGKLHEITWMMFNGIKLGATHLTSVSAQL